MKSTDVRDCKLKVESQRIYDGHGKYHNSPAAKCCCVSAKLGTRQGWRQGSGKVLVPEKVLDKFRSRLRETKIQGSLEVTEEF